MAMGNAKEFYNIVDDIPETTDQGVESQEMENNLSLLNKLNSPTNRKHLVKAAQEGFEGLDKEENGISKRDKLFAQASREITSRIEQSLKDTGSMTTLDRTNNTKTTTLDVQDGFIPTTPAERGLGFMLASMDSPSKIPNGEDVKTYFNDNMNYIMSFGGYQPHLGTPGEYIKTEDIESSDEQDSSAKFQQTISKQKSIFKDKESENNQYDETDTPLNKLLGSNEAEIKAKEQELSNYMENTGVDANQQKDFIKTLLTAFPRLLGDSGTQSQSITKITEENELDSHIFIRIKGEDRKKQTMKMFHTVNSILNPTETEQTSENERNQLDMNNISPGASNLITNLGLLMMEHQKDPKYIQKNKKKIAEKMGS